MFYLKIVEITNKSYKSSFIQIKTQNIILKQTFPAVHTATLVCEK